MEKRGGCEVMFWIALAKAINNLQQGVQAQDDKRKMAAYNTSANLPVDNQAIQFGLNPNENESPKILLKSPY